MAQTNTKKALFVGSFDPFTLGHQSLVEKAMHLFDEMTIGIAVSSGKQKAGMGLLKPEQRQEIIRKCIEKFDADVRVDIFKGLTVDYCKKNKIKYIIRGVRNLKDFEYEKSIADSNKALNSSIETIFMLSDQQYSHVTSSIVREVFFAGGNISPFVPPSCFSFISDQSK